MGAAILAVHVVSNLIFLSIRVFIFLKNELLTYVCSFRAFSELWLEDMTILKK